MAHNEVQRLDGTSGALDRSSVYTRLGGPAAASGVIILCDHARFDLPPEHGTLGLPEAELRRHIGYDIGAEGVTRTVAKLLGLPGVLSHYSRLLIDLNRGLDDPTLIMQLSDGAIVPGNRGLDQAERARRIERIYQPYHNAVRGLVDDHMAAGITPILLSIHSFTPVFKGIVRPWHASVLWGQDGRLAKPLLRALRSDPELVIGDNEPYEGVLTGDTLWQHGEQRGVPHAILEVRQDLITTLAGQAEWGARIAQAMSAIVGRITVTDSEDAHERFVGEGQGVVDESGSVVAEAIPGV